MLSSTFFAAVASAGGQGERGRTDIGLADEGEAQQQLIKLLDGHAKPAVTYSTSTHRNNDR